MDLFLSGKSSVGASRFLLPDVRRNTYGWERMTDAPIETSIEIVDKNHEVQIESSTVSSPIEV